MGSRLPFLFFILLLTHSKITKRILNLSGLNINPQVLFIAKFDIGPPEGDLTLEFKKMNWVEDQREQFSIGLLSDDNYHQFRKSKGCLDKAAFFNQTQQIQFTSSSSGYNFFKIVNQTKQHIWYLYLFDCKEQAQKGSELKGSLQFQVKMLNNGSNFGQDQNFLPGYILLFLTWILLIIKFFIPVINSMSGNNVNWHQTFIYSAFVLLGLAYFYRLISLIFIYLQGQQIWYLVWIYKIIKYLVQGVMVTVITSIGWGWSLTHLKQESYYIIAGTVISLINLMAMILQTSLSQLEESHHQYQSILGLALIFIRLIILLVFVIGILRCLTQSVGKRKHFIKRFGYIGGLYFIAWPATVMLVQIFLPNYMHNQVVTIVEQVSHIVAIAYMCHLFAFPDNDFRKIKLRDEDEDDGLIPDYKSKK